MKVQIEELSPIRKKLSVELPHEDYLKALDKAYQKLGQKVSIKGFRKGKVPRSILERYYGSKTEMETISQVIDQSYQQAIRENSIIAVDLPKISDLKMEAKQPITFTAEVEVQPKIEAKDYLEISLKKNKIEVSDEELDAELKAMQKAHAQRVPVEGEVVAENHHLVTIHYHGTLEGVPFEGGAAQNISLELGMGRFLPDFEKGILGMKKGETREIEVTFPEDYGHESFRGKTARFKIELLEIKKEVLPELDDEFAKDIGPFESMAKVKAELKGHMEKTKEDRERGELFKQILEHLISKNAFEIPVTMIERELDYMLRTVKDQLQQQGLTLEKVGLSEPDYRAKNREEATKRIKGFLLFDSIAVQNNLTVAEEDLRNRMAEIAAKYKQPVEALQKYYLEQGLMRPLYNQILEEKTLEFIISKAKVEEKK